MVNSVKEIKDLNYPFFFLVLFLIWLWGGGRVLIFFRLIKNCTTLKYLIKEGAKIVILGHIGREKTDSLKPISRYLHKTISHTFIENIYSEKLLEQYNDMKSGDVLLFENLRKYDGEKDNDITFTKHLAQFGEIFINEAFSVSHREHASVVGLPALMPSYAGFQFIEEIKELSKAFDPVHPFVLIIGGAKFDTKLPLIEKFIKKADALFVAGALANDVYQYKGYEVGLSLVSGLSKEVLDPIMKSGKMAVPSDVLILGNSLEEIKDPSKLQKNDRIVDAGNKAVKDIEIIIKGAKLIIWNGPFGLYEKGFDKATIKVAKLLAKSKATTIVGGGDTVAVVESQKLINKYTFVSTAGGAMLDFLEKGTIVGIEAMK